MQPFRTRSVVPAIIGLFAMLLAGLVLVTPAFAADSDVKINEFSSNSPDFVELINTGSGTVDLSGWVLKDSTENNAYTIPAGTSLAAGEIRGFSGEGVEFAFGLGNGDAVRLFTPSSATLVDSVTYAAHPAATKSWGRCPDGTGAIVLTEVATKGTANSCGTPNTAVKINEFSSNSPDFIELTNTGGGPVNISGWILKDSTDNNAYTFPAGSSIAPGEIKPLSGEGVDFAFGLGGGDAVRLFLSDGTTLIDNHTYPAHAPSGKSYGRCPNGTGDFVITAEATKGSANLCPIPAGGENIKINEVESDPNDKVELVNTGETSVDLGGYVLKDNDDTHVFTIPAGTSLAAHAFITFDVNAAYGLGKGDSVRLYTPLAARLLDSTTYPVDTHATNWGRCPDGTGDFGVTEPTLGSANICGPVGPPDVVINEVESNGDQVADWVELKNRGASTVNISGWKILDNDPSHAATPVVVPAGTSIAPGGYYAIYTEISQSPGFGLGVGDSVTVFLADGTTQVDTTTWGPHAATTWGRCPDGTGAFGDTTTSTRGLANACSPIRINEIEADGGTPGDWVELANISNAPVDISGWSIKDSDNANTFTVPAGTSVAAKGYQVFDISAFDLGTPDAVRLLDGTSTLIESYSWTVHAGQSYARCKDGIGDFTDSKAVTKGAANSCPGLETSPWPGSQTVTTADLPETHVQDLSGLTFDPANPDILWAAQNKKGTLFKLVRNGDNKWVPAAGWPKDPKYAATPNSVNGPDTEGLTIGPDGFVYLASERNNDASGVSRMSVLRYDPAATGTTITPTNEWDLTSKIPAAGANLGLEGVAFVPDSYLTGNGFKDQSTGAAYSPATYPNHGTGLYFVAVEDTGDLHAFALDSDGTTSHLVATIDSGFPKLADVVFDPERQRVWAVTDDTVDGKTALLKVDASGAFVVDVAYDRPVGMPNLNNEGLAIAPQSRCVAGKKEVLWSDDGDTDGNSIRRGEINCTVLELTAPTPTIGGTPKVGEILTATAGTWGPAPVALTYQWFAGGVAIANADSNALLLTGAQSGKTITVAVTGTKTDYPSVTRTSTATAAVAAGTLTGPVPTIAGTPKVGETLTATAGTWGPDPVILAYQWFVGSTPIAGATTTQLVIEPSQAGANITVVVTGTKSGYTTLAKTSAATQPVANGTLSSAVPTITGTPANGSTLTAVPGTWGPAPVKLSYQWFADGSPVAGGTAATLVLGNDQVGTTLTVVVTGTKPGFTAVSQASVATAPVAAAALTSTVPTITGTAKVGVKLTAVPGAWGPAPVVLKYQWFAGSSPIAGATAATFTPTGAHAGKVVTVRVTGSKAGYTTKTVASAGRTVAKGTLTSAKPKITGTVKVGKTLTAVPGTWGPAPVALKYVWKVNGKVVAGGKTFKVPASAKGKKITVTVTGSKTGYTSVVQVSAATVKAAAR